MNTDFVVTGKGRRNMEMNNNTSNAEKFKQIFGIYATELWAMPEEEFLEWVNNDFNNALAEQQWISCGVRLPEADTRYRVIYENGEVGYADFRNKLPIGTLEYTRVWIIPDYHGDDGRVIAWMSEPYKEDKHD